MEFIVAFHDLCKIWKLLFDKRGYFNSNFKAFAAKKYGRISEHHKIAFCFILLNFSPEAAIRGILSKKCSENMQQIYRRKPMPKCNFIEITLGHGVLL